MSWEKRYRQSATKKLIEQYPQCCFCAGMRPATTREHMPPKSLFDGSHRPDRLVMPSCDECNRGTSTADLTAAIVCRWNYDTDDVEVGDHNRLVRRLRKQAPDVVEEWTNNGNPLRPSKGRRHLRRHGVPVPVDAAIVTIGPATIRQLNIFAHKATLALYFERFRRPLAAPSVYSAIWRTKEDMHQGVPSSLLDLMPEYGALLQGEWDTSETFEYRLNINMDDGLFAFIARLRWGLFVSGFVVGAERDRGGEDDWMQSGDLLLLANTPRFLSKL
jgi:hypothetical protein